MIVLVRFVERGDSKTKTLYNEFSSNTVKTQYREPIDDATIRLLAAKILFDNNAEHVNVWFGKLPDREDQKLSQQMEPIIKVIGKR